MRSLRSFVNLLVRFLTGTSTQQENETIEKWYCSLDKENNYPHLDRKQAEVILQEEYELIRRRIKKDRRSVFLSWTSLAAAAIILFGICLFYFVNNSRLNATDIIASKKDSKIILLPGSEFYNDSGNAIEVLLVDSSSVQLQPQGLLAIAGNFNRNERTITLEGEGFFKIKRDETKPFNVLTYGIVTKVLGTSFNVKAPSENEQVTISVMRGSVMVFKGENTSAQNLKEHDQVVLTPNQLVTFDPLNKSLKPSLVEKPAELSVEKIRTEYLNEPITKILDDISQLYGIEVIYNAETLKCKITTAFQDEGLYERLDILAKVTGAKYTVEGTRIVIESKGC